MGLLLALLAALPVTLLPPTSAELAPEVARAAVQALRGALPPPWQAAPLDQAVFAEHLAAAGPACRTDLTCLCSVAPFTEGALALDLRLERVSAKTWSADLRLAEPCAGEVLDRRAATVEATAAALARFLADAAVALLRGRDLGDVRYSGGATLKAPEARPAKSPAAAPPAKPAPASVAPDR